VTQQQRDLNNDDNNLDWQLDNNHDTEATTTKNPAASTADGHKTVVTAKRF